MIASHLPFYIGVAVFGAAVGASELIARYKDEPFRVIRTTAALAYVLINALAATGAYFLILTFKIQFGASDPEAVAWTQAFVAGFGAMAFFRTSLFSVRVGNNDVPVGPGIFLQIILYAVDRACDRARAQPRSSRVNSIMQGVSFELARDGLPAYCFEIMQNIPGDEQQQFALVVDALASSKSSDDVKILNLGLLLMNLVGDRVLEAAVNALGVRIQGPSKLDGILLLKLTNVDFAKAYPLIIDVCFNFSRKKAPAETTLLRDDLVKSFQPTAENQSIHNAAKLQLLAIALQQRVGLPVLISAIDFLGSQIQLAPKAEVPAKGAEVPPQDPAVPAAAPATGNIVLLPTAAAVADARDATHTEPAAGGLEDPAKDKDVG
jgi:hypothetical protein